MMNIFTLALLPVLFLASAGENAKVPNHKPRVEFREGRLSVKAENAPLGILLEEIGKKSAIEIELNDPKATAKTVTVDLKGAIPGRALREILQGLNYAFFYSKTRLSRVVIVPEGTAIAGGSRGRFGAGRNMAGGFQGKWKGALQGRPAVERDKALEAKLDAIETLEESEDPKSVDELGKALTDPNADVKSAALDALSGKEGDNVKQALRRGLNDPDPEFRVEVLEALAERGDLDAVRKALSDPDPEVKEAAQDLLESAAP